MKREDLFYITEQENGDQLFLTWHDDRPTFLGITEGGGSEAGIYLDDNTLRAIRRQINLILETEPKP